MSKAQTLCIRNRYVFVCVSTLFVCLFTLFVCLSILFVCLSTLFVCLSTLSHKQLICRFVFRYIETESIAEKYGNKETIERLREERKALESEEFKLKTELKKAENLLSEYESLDKDLLKEYRQLKSELDCRLWALNELNQSSGSASNGSLNGLSD